jgi:hypothetical protein
MMMTQIDARNRADRAGMRHGSRQAMRGNTHAHAALHDGQQAPASNGK